MLTEVGTMRKNKTPACQKCQPTTYSFDESRQPERRGRGGGNAYPINKMITKRGLPYKSQTIAVSYLNFGPPLIFSILMGLFKNTNHDYKREVLQDAEHGR